MRIGILLGSTRPIRNGEQVALWVWDQASRRGDALFERIDLRDHPLPHLDEPLPALYRRYEHAHTKAWASRIAAFDGFVIVTPEYNHSTPGALKNALDHLYAEWNNKAVGIVSYGADGGARAAENLRLVCGALQMPAVAAQVTLPFATEFDFTNVAPLRPGAFRPSGRSLAALETLLDQVVAWSAALSPLRTAIGTEPG